MTHKERAKILLAQLQENKMLPVSYEIGRCNLIQRTSTAGNYSVIFWGTFKEICIYLEGMQHLEMLNYPTNKNIL